MDHQTYIHGILGGTGTRTIGQYSRLEKSGVSREREEVTNKLKEMPWQRMCRFTQDQWVTGAREACQWEMGWEEERGKWKPMLEKQVRVLVFAFKLGVGGRLKEGDYQGCQKTATIASPRQEMEALWGHGRGGNQGRGHRRDGRKARWRERKTHGSDSGTWPGQHSQWVREHRVIGVGEAGNREILRILEMCCQLLIIFITDPSCLLSREAGRALSYWVQTSERSL